MKGQPQGNRRIVRRAVMVLAGAVLLVVAYVGSYATMFWWSGTQLHSNPDWHGVLATAQTTVFAPLHVYCASSLPGSDSFNDLLQWCYWQGVNSSVPPGE